MIDGAMDDVDDLVELVLRYDDRRCGQPEATTVKLRHRPTILAQRPPIAFDEQPNDRSPLSV